MVLGEDAVKAVLSDPCTAPISEKLRKTLAFLEKLTLTPQDVGPASITPLRAAGVSDQAVEDAIFICALFNMIDRLADALGFSIPSPAGFARGGEYLLKHGY